MVRIITLLSLHCESVVIETLCLNETCYIPTHVLEPPFYCIITLLHVIVTLHVILHIITLLSLPCQSVVPKTLCLCYTCYIHTHVLKLPFDRIITLLHVIVILHVIVRIVTLSSLHCHTVVPQNVHMY